MFNYIKQSLIILKFKYFFSFILSIFFLLNCSDAEFKSQWELDETPQIIAIKIEPPDVKTGDEVLSKISVHWKDENLSYLWIRCIPKVGLYSTDCVSSFLESNDFIPECSDDSSEVCIFGRDATAIFTVPSITNLPEDQPFFYVESIVSDKNNVEQNCFDSIKNNFSSSNCLIGIKRILYTDFPYKMQNPIISEVTIDGTDITSLTSLKAKQSYQINLKTDEEPLNSLLLSDEDTYYLKVYWFTDCGEMEGIADDEDPLNRNPYVSSLKCNIDHNNQKINCLDIQNILNVTDFENSCQLYIVLSNKMGGIDYKEYVFTN